MEKLLRPWPAGHALNLIDTFIMLKAKQNKLSSCHKSILGMGNLFPLGFQEGPVGCY